MALRFDLNGNPLDGVPLGQRGAPRELTPQAKAKGKDPDPRGTELARLSDENARLKIELADVKAKLADAVAANKPKLVTLVTPVTQPERNSVTPERNKELARLRMAKMRAAKKATKGK